MLNVVEVHKRLFTTRNELWCCMKCSSKLLPFSNLDNHELYLEMPATPIPSPGIVQGMPSFTIQSLLDEMPGHNYETDETMSETSKYFTHSQFLESKLPKNMFSMIHVNIASLSKHIEELRSLLSVLNHPFDIIGITGTRIHDETQPVNVNIEGYEFKRTPTSTPCGGAGMDIKSCHNFEMVKNLIKSIDDVSESLFIEIKISL